MQRPTRTQADGDQEHYSLLTALDCSTHPAITRQEFRDETDVNNILARYGVDGLRRPIQYSEVDYDMDLQQSLEAIREAERAVNRLPEALRTKYTTWERLLDGAFSGEFKQDLATYEADQTAKKAALDAARKPAVDSPPTQDPRD